MSWVDDGGQTHSVFWGTLIFGGFLLGGIFGFWHADFADSGDFWFGASRFLGIVWWGR